MNIWKQASITFTVLSSCLFADPHSQSYEVIPDQNTLEIATPSLQKQETLKIRLSNGLEALLISDPSIDKSACAMAVGVGSWADPKEYPGMAHFLEHMLFMGTKPYPEEAMFQKYVSDHGGSMNAYTSSEETVYMFSINNENFAPCLDQFAHFFIDPLLDASSVSRELKAVDQEYDKNKEHDFWRAHMIFKKLGNQNHPNSQFSIGSAETLGKIPLSELRNWFETYYVAKNMHLVVYSSQPMETLVKHVTEDFESVSQNDVAYVPQTDTLLSDELKNHMVVVKPIQDLKILELSFELPIFASEMQETKSANLIASVLSSQTKGSLYDILKKEQLIESIDASSGAMGKNVTLFQVEFELTEKGINDIDAVIERFFQTIALLQKTNIPPYLFDEAQKMAKISYEHQSRFDAFATVKNHARNLIKEDIATYPMKTNMPLIYDREQIESILSVLTPQNCLFTLLANPAIIGLEADQREKWMGGEYTTIKMNRDKLTSWSKVKPTKDLALPQRNPFIPDNLAVTTFPNEKEKPKIIYSAENGLAYRAIDNQYLVPEIDWTFHIKTPLLDGSPKAYILSDLFAKTFDDNLSSTLTYASKAGLGASISFSDFKLSLSVTGFNEKADLLLSKALFTLKNQTTSREEFEIYKNSLRIDLENAAKASPISIANRIMSNVIYSNSHLPKTLLIALSLVSYEEFITFTKNLFDESYTEAMLTGNISSENAKDTFEKALSIISEAPYPVELQKGLQVLALPGSSGPYLIEENSPMLGNAALLLIQEGSFSLSKNASREVLASSLSEAFFDTLRTKQQTGYLVRAFSRVVESEMMQFFAVQSTTHSSSELLPRFELFLEEYAKDIHTHISIDRFSQIKKSLLTTLKTPLTNIFEYSALLNTLAFTYNGDFDLIEKKIAALEELSYEDFILDAKEFISRRNSKRLAVLIQGSSTDNKSLEYELISKKEIRDMGKYVSWKDNPISQTAPIGGQALQ